MEKNEEEIVEEENIMPTNLEECIAELNINIPSGEIEQIKGMDIDEFVAVAHHSLGRHLRNEWGLWKDSILLTYFKELGLQHPDDMSGLILRCFHKQLNGQPFDIEGWVAYCKEYWKNTGK